MHLHYFTSIGPRLWSISRYWIDCGEDLEIDYAVIMEHYTDPPHTGPIYNIYNKFVYLTNTFISIIICIYIQTPSRQKTDVSMNLLVTVSVCQSHCPYLSVLLAIKFYLQSQLRWSAPEEWWDRGSGMCQSEWLFHLKCAKMSVLKIKNLLLTNNRRRKLFWASVLSLDYGHQ